MYIYMAAHLRVHARVFMALNVVYNKQGAGCGQRLAYIIPLSSWYNILYLFILKSALIYYIPKNPAGDHLSS